MLTKGEVSDIIAELSRGEAFSMKRKKDLEKKDEKSSKKYLTKGKRCDIIDELSHQKGDLRSSNCTLKIEQRKKKTKHIILENSATVKRCKRVSEAYGNM